MNDSGNKGINFNLEVSERAKGMSLKMEDVLRSIELPPKFSRLIQRPELIGTITNVVLKREHVDKDFLRKSLVATIENQETMRSTYAVDNDICHMNVQQPSSVEVKINSFEDIDLLGGVTAFDEGTVMELVARVKKVIPKLSPPYLDLYLFQSGTESLIILHTWHFVYDGPSIGILLEIIDSNYQFYSNKATACCLPQKRFSDYVAALKGWRNASVEKNVTERINADQVSKDAADEMFRQLSVASLNKNVGGLKYVFSLLPAEDSKKIEELCGAWKISYSVYWQICFLLALNCSGRSSPIDYCYLIDLRLGKEFGEVIGFFGTSAMQRVHIDDDMTIGNLFKKINMNNLASITESLQTEWLPPDVYSRLHLNSASYIFSYEGNIDDTSYVYNTRIDLKDNERVRYLADSCYDAIFCRYFNGVVLRVKNVGARFLLNVEHVEESRDFAVELSDRMINISSDIFSLTKENTVRELCAGQRN